MAPHLKSTPIPRASRYSIQQRGGGSGLPPLLSFFRHWNQITIWLFVFVGGFLHPCMLFTIQIRFVKDVNLSLFPFSDLSLIIGGGASYTCLARGYPWEWSIRSQNPSNEEGKRMLELHSPNTFSSFLVLLILLGDAARLLSFKSSLSCTTCQIESLILVVYKSLTPLASQNFSYSLIF